VDCMDPGLLTCDPPSLVGLVYRPGVRPGVNPRVGKAWQFNGGSAKSPGFSLDF
jgi:hypothetical protein